MIHYSGTFLKFLKEEDSKIARLLAKATWAEEGHEFPAYKLFVTNKQIDYLNHRDDGTLSFLPAGKEHKVNEGGQWMREGRQNGKPAKVLRKLFTDNALKVLKPQLFEEFTNKYKTMYSVAGYSFKLLPHKEIKATYRRELKPGGGSLNNSCMNGDSKYLGIYSNKQIQILILETKEGLLCGRCLVWTIGDKTIMDRFYVSDDYMYEMFISFAEQNKFYYKENYKTFDYKRQFINPEGDPIKLDLLINLNTDHNYFPYIDTFSSGDDGWLCNYGDGPYDYNKTNGSRSGDSESEPEEDDHYGECYDEIAEEDILSEDSVTLSDEGSRGFAGKTTFEGDTVDIEGETYHIEDPKITKLSDEYVLKAGVEVEFGGSQTFIDMYNDGAVDLCDFIKLDGKYYHENDWAFVMQAGFRYGSTVLRPEMRDFVCLEEKPYVSQDPDQTLINF